MCQGKQCMWISINHISEDVCHQMVSLVYLQLLSFEIKFMHIGWNGQVLLSQRELLGNVVHSLSPQEKVYVRESVRFGNKLQRPWLHSLHYLTWKEHSGSISGQFSLTRIIQFWKRNVVNLENAMSVLGMDILKKIYPQKQFVAARSHARKGKKYRQQHHIKIVSLFFQMGRSNKHFISCMFPLQYRTSPVDGLLIVDDSRFNC